MLRSLPPLPGPPPDRPLPLIPSLPSPSCSTRAERHSIARTPSAESLVPLPVDTPEGAISASSYCLQHHSSSLEVSPASSTSTLTLLAIRSPETRPFEITPLETRHCEITPRQIRRSPELRPALDDQVAGEQSRSGAISPHSWSLAVTASHPLPLRFSAGAKVHSLFKGPRSEFSLGRRSAVSYQSLCSSSIATLHALIDEVQIAYKGLGPSESSYEDLMHTRGEVVSFMDELDSARFAVHNRYTHEEYEVVKARFRALNALMTDANARYEMAHKNKKSAEDTANRPVGIVKKGKKKVTFDPETLFEDKSKLIDVDLPKYFKSPKAAETLNDNDRAELRKLLPDNMELTDEGMPKAEFLKYNIDWRNALRYFALDLQEGRLGETWLHPACEAMESRALGHFDTYKADYFEDYWGQKGDAPAENAPATFYIGKEDETLEDLVRAEKICVGDHWCFAQVFGREEGEKGFVVEKNCLVVQIKNMVCILEIPPDQDKVFRPLKRKPRRRQLRKRSLKDSTPEDDKQPFQSKNTNNGFSGGATEGGEKLAQEAALPALEVDQDVHPFYAGLEMRSFGPSGQPATSSHESAKKEEQGLTSGNSIRVPSGNVFRTMLTRSKSKATKPKSVVISASSPKTELPNLEATETNTKTDWVPPSSPPDETNPHKHPHYIPVRNPEFFIQQVLEIDGRVAPDANMDAWKLVRIVRSGKNRGTLQQISAKFHNMSGYTLQQY